VPTHPEFVCAKLNKKSPADKAAGFQAEFADRVKPDFPVLKEKHGRCYHH
jgi:hypothetical protein